LDGLVWREQLVDDLLHDRTSSRSAMQTAAGKRTINPTIGLLTCNHLSVVVRCGSHAKRTTSTDGTTEDVPAGRCNNVTLRC
jgi:hypothetical protein